MPGVAAWSAQGIHAPRSIRKRHAYWEGEGEVIVSERKIQVPALCGATLENSNIPTRGQERVGSPD